MRELTRIDRAADADGPVPLGRRRAAAPPDADADEIRPSFPAVFCRHCGRSGWGVGLAPVGRRPGGTDDEAIRRNHAVREGRFRALIYAPREADAAYLTGERPTGCRGSRSAPGQLLTVPPGEDDPDLLRRLGAARADHGRRRTPTTTRARRHLPVVRPAGRHPVPGQRDRHPAVGVAVARCSARPTLDRAEKKALVFTDSVQDAAHRAGFVQARSHTLTLRAVLREAVGDGPLTLDDLVDEVMRQRRRRPVRPLPDPGRRTAPTGSRSPRSGRRRRRGAVPASVRTRVRRRLALDAALEFGLNSRTGRTLELTGAVAVEVDAGAAGEDGSGGRVALRLARTRRSRTRSTAAGRRAPDRRRHPGAVGARACWTGCAPRAPSTTRGSTATGERTATAGRSGAAGRAARACPRSRRVGRRRLPAVGGGRAAGDSGSGPGHLPPSPGTRRGRRGCWRSAAADGGGLCRLLLERLARDGVLTATSSESGATVYAIPPSGVIVAGPQPPTSLPAATCSSCDTCRAPTPGSTHHRRPARRRAVPGGPLPRPAAAGPPLEDNFYRRLYASPDMRRVVAREHTSLLDDETRLAYENGFKGAGTDPHAPNVLVATPTLEMGIDIGDLSSVFLASLPRTVASYLQRVGRAGRLTGNALDLAYVTGRGEQLPKLGDPLSVINGEVRPPATYLRAEEILRRQYTAHLVDEFARDPTGPTRHTAAGRDRLERSRHLPRAT